MTQTTEVRVIATLELIHDALNELVTQAKELITVAKKRQASRDTTNFKEIFSGFSEEMKEAVHKLTSPPPLPEPLLPRYEPPPRIKREVKIVHLNDYIHNRTGLDEEINRLVSEENYILLGVTDYHIVFQRGRIEEVDAEFMGDGGKVNVQ